MLTENLLDSGHFDFLKDDAKARSCQISHVEDFRRDLATIANRINLIANNYFNRASKDQLRQVIDLHKNPFTSPYSRVRRAFKLVDIKPSSKGLVLVFYSAEHPLKDFDVTEVLDLLESFETILFKPKENTFRS